MKNTYFKLFAAAILFCGFSMGVISCKDNDDDSVTAKKKCRLVQYKEVSDQNDEYYITSFGYDAQGRVTSFKIGWYNNPKVGDVLTVHNTYTYADHSIIEKHGDGYIYYFTLSDDGLIVKQQINKVTDGVETTESNYYFQYDDGRLISAKDDRGSYQNVLHWEDGDMMYYRPEETGKFSDNTEYTRSGLSVDHGYQKPPLAVLSEPLYMMGYYGKPSKHLESKRKFESDKGPMYILVETDYTYTIADRHIVEMVEDGMSASKSPTFETKSKRKSTFTFTYEEY